MGILWESCGFHGHFMGNLWDFMRFSGNFMGINGILGEFYGH